METRVYALQPRQYCSKASDQVLYVAHDVRKGNRIHAPAVLVGLTKRFYRKDTHRPDQARSRTIGSYYEPVSSLAPFWVLELSDCAIAPALGSALFDEWESMVDGSIAGAGKKGRKRWVRGPRLLISANRLAVGNLALDHTRLSESG